MTLGATRPLTAPLLHDGRAWPLGATVRDGGVNFAVFAQHATAVELCLFDDDGLVEVARVPLPARSADVWHGFLPEARAGLIYGLRAHGPWRPDHGHRYNPYKLLLDPWAREIVGRYAWHPSQFAADADHPQHMNQVDNAARALKGRVIDDAWDWQGDRRVLRPLDDTVIYEVHLRSMTRLMPGVPQAHRGTYLGLASPAAIAHLQRLGVTALSILPVHQHIDEQRLVEHGLVNHWGYNTIGFFCPDPRYATAHDGRTARDEFRTMVQTLHAAGIEVLLDVVYNHTAEGDERGPTISFRGLDHRAWYRLTGELPARCINDTGCGNTLDLRHPRVLQLVLDSLRYWVQEMHVDGFRFDLAPVLGRGDHGFDRHHPFFVAVMQDPVLAGVKLIAEPWDIGPGGYQLGGFPHGWLEWNDRFRDTARAFWLGGDATRGQFAQRLAASSDIFQPRGRTPAESVNYVVSHDGYTLHDLVSYDLRHNEANLEDNRDGHAHNLSWNCGWEGETGDPRVLMLRARLKRALLATTLLAQGTPMLAAGDELGHTQQGNNNPYCQDNAITWIDWSRADDELIAFTAHVIGLRRRLHPLGARWYTGLANAHGRDDLAWLRRTGAPFNAEQWTARGLRILGAWIGSPGGGGAPLLLLVNAREFDAPFMLPAGRWLGLLDTTQPDGRWAGAAPAAGGVSVVLPSRSLWLMEDLEGPTR
ncbi:MAG: glycogen debranching protein GlgX [Rubrivivax sp.]|nr:glycogen debranching protein GlgX [Rubrivivax sp.]